MKDTLSLPMVHFSNKFLAFFFKKKNFFRQSDFGLGHFYQYFQGRFFVIMFFFCDAYFGRIKNSFSIVTFYQHFCTNTNYSFLIHSIRQKCAKKRANKTHAQKNSTQIRLKNSFGNVCVKVCCLFCMNSTIYQFVGKIKLLVPNYI